MNCLFKGHTKVDVIRSDGTPVQGKKMNILATIQYCTRCGKLFYRYEKLNGNS